MGTKGSTAFQEEWARVREMRNNLLTGGRNQLGNRSHWVFVHTVAKAKHIRKCVKNLSEGALLSQ